MLRLFVVVVVVCVLSLCVGTIGGSLPKLLEALRNSSSSSPSHVVDGSITHVQNSPPSLQDAPVTFTMSIVYAANHTSSVDWLDSTFPKMVTGLCSTMIKWDIIPVGDVTVDDKGTIKCKKGKEQCNLMKHHACLVDMRQQAHEELWLNKNIQCLSHFGQDILTDDIWEFCIGQERYSKVKQCVKQSDSKGGDALLKQFVEKAEKLHFKKNNILPAVAINGKPLENNGAAMADGVCKASSKRHECCHNWPHYDYDL